MDKTHALSGNITLWNDGMKGHFLKSQIYRYPKESII